MKKIMVVTVAMVMVSVAVLIAQNPVKRTTKITLDEVPLSVKTSFLRDFGTIPQEGFWLVHFVIEATGSETSARPVWYSYNKKTKTEKVEARYSPEGKLMQFKGLEKVIPKDEGTESLEKPQKIG